MHNPNLSDEQIWALRARESYNRQLEGGESEPYLPENLLWSIPGGDAISELGKLGLVTAAYPDGVRIEPESKYPRRGEDALIKTSKEAA